MANRAAPAVEGGVAHGAPSRWLNDAWAAVITVAWAAPLLIFVVMHASVPAPVPWVFAVVALALAGIGASVRLPEAIYRPCAFERDGRVYRLLGVRAFGAIVPGGRRLGGHDALARRSGGVDVSLRRIEAATRAGEGTHWWWLLSSAAIAVWALAIAAYGFLLLIAVAAVPLNVYPILLHRHTRARVARLLLRRRARARAEPQPIERTP